MKKLLLASAAALAVMAYAKPAEAVLITYGASGTFGCGSIASGCAVVNGATSSTLTVNGITITYTGYTAITTDANATPSNINYGSFLTTGTGTAVSFSGATFSLSVSESVPAPTGGSPFGQNGSLTGSISTSSSGTFVTFSGPFSNTVTFSGGAAIFAMTEADLGGANSGQVGNSAIPQPCNSGTCIPNAIDAQLQVVPEPASMLLLGTGLLGLGGTIRRKLNRK